MSVAILFLAGEECLAEVPVATEKQFQRCWGPVIKNLGLPLLGKWDAGVNIGPGDAPALIREIQAVASFFRERVSDDWRDDMVGRADRAVTAIQKYTRDTRVDSISLG